MKSTLLLATATLFCMGFGSVFAAPAWAESASEPSTVSQSEDTVDLEHSREHSADVLLVEPRGLNVGSGVDAETWDAVASQINQGINSDEEDEFLPEGVVMRGSENSLQLGSELP